MNNFFEGRSSDSPYIQGIWHGHTIGMYTPICPAAAEWNLLLQRKRGKITVLFEGPLTRAKAKLETEDIEFCVIRFKAGTFLPVIPIKRFLDIDVCLPLASRGTFWLHGMNWEFPRFEDVEGFVSRLVREEVLLRDPLVSAVLHDQLHELSPRTVRRRFLQSTGLTPKQVAQIDRAARALAMLTNSVAILDVV
ncbi:MAG: AraC family transcriptional regulator, partial [Burkholderiales bacterium]|nr:AraC family transcriptional regulator [Anaerolineae bacterium]